jgi:hypothetical protein
MLPRVPAPQARWLSPWPTQQVGCNDTTDAGTTSCEWRAAVPGDDHVLSCVAIALAKIGKADEARRVAQDIHEVPARAQALSAVVAALARNHRWEEAQSLADNVPDFGPRARAFSSVVAVLAEEGNWKEAKRAVSDPGCRGLLPSVELWLPRCLRGRAGESSRTGDQH